MDQTTPAFTNKIRRLFDELTVLAREEYTSTNAKVRQSIRQIIAETELEVYKEIKNA